MIVNINQCAATYDETLHVMKFSAVAKQVGQVPCDGGNIESWKATWAHITSHLQVVQMVPEKPLESLAPCLVGCDGRPLVRNGLVDGQALEDGSPEEELLLLLQEDEAEMSLLPQNVSLLPSVCVQAFAPVSVPSRRNW